MVTIARPLRTMTSAARGGDTSFREHTATRAQPVSEEPRRALDHPFTGTVLAYVDGSEWSIRAMRFLQQHRRGRMLLLYVAPRAAEGYLECGRMVLEAALRRCRLSAEDPAPECRLEVGEPAERILAVCRETWSDVLAMGSTGVPDVPHAIEPGVMAQKLWAECACQVLLASRRGIELLVGGERLLIAPRTSRATGAPLSAGAPADTERPLTGARAGGTRDRSQP